MAKSKTDYGINIDLSAEAKSAKTFAEATDQITSSLARLEGLDLSQFNVSAQTAGAQAAQVNKKVRESGEGATYARARFDMLYYTYQNISTMMSSLAIGAGSLGTAFSDAASTSVNAFAEYEDSLQAVRRTTLEIGADAKQLNSDLISVITTVAADTGAVQEIAEIGGAANVSADNMRDFAEASAIFSDSTEVSAQKASLSLAKIWNLTNAKNPGMTYENLANSIFVVGNESATTADQILEMTTKMAPLAAQFNATADEVIGLSSSLASFGIGAERGGTSIIRSFAKVSSIIAEGGQKLELMSKISGMSADGAAEHFLSAATTEGTEASVANEVSISLRVRTLNMLKTILFGTTQAEKQAAAATMNTSAANGKAAASTKALTTSLKVLGAATAAVVVIDLISAAIKNYNEKLGKAKQSAPLTRG